MTHRTDGRLDSRRRGEAAEAAEKARAGRTMPRVDWMDAERPDGTVVLWPWARGAMSARPLDDERILECAEIARYLAIELRADVDNYPGPESEQDYETARADAERWIAAAELAYKGIEARLRALRAPF